MIGTEELALQVAEMPRQSCPHRGFDQTAIERKDHEVPAVMKPRRGCRGRILRIEMPRALVWCGYPFILL